jgi:hypothetical protein
MGIGRQTVVLCSAVIGTQALTGVALHIFWTAGDKGNAFVTVLDQVLHRFEHSAAIVSRDRGPAFSSGDKDHWMPSSNQILQIARSRLGV